MYIFTKEKKRVHNWESNVINKRFESFFDEWYVLYIKRLSHENNFFAHHLLFLKLFLVISLSNKDCINPHMHKMGLGGPKHYISGNHFYSKNARKSRFHVFPHCNAKNHLISSFYLKQTKFTKIVNLFQFSSGPRGPTIGTKFTISYEFGLLQVK